MQEGISIKAHSKTWFYPSDGDELFQSLERREHRRLDAPVLQTGGVNQDLLLLQNVDSHPAEFRHLWTSAKAPALAEFQHVNAKC